MWVGNLLLWVGVFNRSTVTWEYTVYPVIATHVHLWAMIAYINASTQQILEGNLLLWVGESRPEHSHLRIHCTPPWAPPSPRRGEVRWGLRGPHSGFIWYFFLLGWGPKTRIEKTAIKKPRSERENLNRFMSDHMLQLSRNTSSEWKWNEVE